MVANVDLVGHLVADDRARQQREEEPLSSYPGPGDHCGLLGGYFPYSISGRFRRALTDSTDFFPSYLHKSDGVATGHSPLFATAPDASWAGNFKVNLSDREVPKSTQDYTTDRIVHSDTIALLRYQGWTTPGEVTCKVFWFVQHTSGQKIATGTRLPTEQARLGWRARATLALANKSKISVGVSVAAEDSCEALEVDTLGIPYDENPEPGGVLPDAERSVGGVSE
ncbi:hypothetical protein THAOC_02031 [Thalassiosira oceanica]|uniref:Uncharacterized protein n=1 Tax=Thalassiosira oceanica TaxID=159749 RepID=K0TGW0_THAOC|nr:hypothetical protein THAOC_02031 [Thalassiosira oceanica]|eukprot:EJK76224.1 hypothetical protein THAOC_02031 [Thalassiosira oceanica]